MSSKDTDREEQYILRIEDADVADRVRKFIHEQPSSPTKKGNLELKFHENPRQGTLTIGDDRVLSVAVQDLPTIVESFKTYDDTNLVKTNDIGQVLVVQEVNPDAVAAEIEAKDGVTPSMRDARRRHFRRKVDASPATVNRVEQDLITILSGGAPPGVEFEDIEEEYVVDQDGEGSWQPVRIKVALPKPKQPRKLQKVQQAPQAPQD